MVCFLYDNGFRHQRVTLLPYAFMITVLNYSLFSLLLTCLRCVTKSKSKVFETQMRSSFIYFSLFNVSFNLYESPALLWITLLHEIDTFKNTNWIPALTAFIRTHFMKLKRLNEIRLITQITLRLLYKSFKQLWK